MPSASGAPPAVALLYNRGGTSDASFLPLIPYASVVSFAVVPLTKSDDNTSTQAVASANEPRPPPLPPLPPLASSAQNATAVPSLVSLGWWCNSAAVKPDQPGLWDNHNQIITVVALPPCSGDADCIANSNLSHVITGPRRCLNATLASGASPLCPYMLTNGSALNSVSDLIRFGRERWGHPSAQTQATDKFLIAETLGSSWRAVVADAACYADQHLSDDTATASNPPACGKVMKSYSHSLCGALAAAGLQWWIFDGKDVYATAQGAQQQATFTAGRGTAQALRYIRATCTVDYALSVSFGWTLHGDSGFDAYMFQNYSTFLGWNATVRRLFTCMHCTVTTVIRFIDGTVTRVCCCWVCCMVCRLLDGRRMPCMQVRVLDLVDFVLPRVWGNPLQEHYLSNSRGAHGGECSPGRDEVIMEWMSGAEAPYRIPREKLIVGIGNSKTLYSCKSSGGAPVQPCVSVPAGCALDTAWTPSRAQAEIYRGVAAGKLTMRYDRWAQQSFVTAATNCSLSDDCDNSGVSYVDCDTAQSWDFQLRQLRWRGAKGYFVQCAEDDYDPKSASHWAQDTGVTRNFLSDSRVFSLDTKAATSPAGGLDVSSGDSICRMFDGARFDSLVDAYNILNCFGTPPASAASAWPFVIHSPFTNDTGAVWSNRDDDGTGNASAAVFQITTKSMAAHGTTATVQDPVQLARNPAYLREVPITSDAGRILASLLGGTVATPAQVRAASKRGASWPQLGLTVHELSPRENDLYGTAPTGSGGGGGGLVQNSLQVFDGGLRGLGAVNVMGTISPATVERVNGDATNPFFVRV